jgi:hypothetical protein
MSAFDEILKRHKQAAADFKSHMEAKESMNAQHSLGMSYAYLNALGLIAETPEQKKIIEELSGND